MEDNKARLDFFKEFNKVQGAIAPLKPDSTNPHFNSKYASLQAVMEAVGPFLEAGFSFHHEGFSDGGKCYLRTNMVRGDHYVVSITPLVDDGNPQHFQSSQTYAKRGNILNLTGLALDVDDDANAVSAPVESRRASAAPTKAPEAQGFEVARFVPSRVDFVDGTGKGSGKTFCAIYRTDGANFSGTEQQGELAESARTSKKEIIVAFEKKGKYMNIKRDGVKFADGSQDNATEIQEVPF